MTDKKDTPNQDRLRDIDDATVRREHNLASDIAAMARTSLGETCPCATCLFLRALADVRTPAKRVRKSSAKPKPTE